MTIKLLECNDIFPIGCYGLVFVFGVSNTASVWQDHYKLNKPLQVQKAGASSLVVRVVGVVGVSRVVWVIGFVGVIRVVGVIAVIGVVGVVSSSQ